MQHSVLIDSKKLKQLREQRVLSQEGLEQACREMKGCSVSIATIKRAERGRTLSHRTAARLASFFSVSVEELIVHETSGSGSSPARPSGENKVCLLLWFQTPSRQLITAVSENASQFEPLMFQRTEEALILAFPDSSEADAQRLRQALLPVCHAFHDYRALITTAILIRPNPFQWQMSSKCVAHVSRLADSIPGETITVHRKESLN